MTLKNAHVPAPDLAITDETPVSAMFGDVYFSRAGGIAETQHVFLNGNGLPERWLAAPHFTIAELGFGTGLNFLVTLKHFRETAAADAVLHYIAIEKHPFTRERLQQVLALQPELAVEVAEFLEIYPLRLPGVHRIHLPRCVLTLCIGDAGEMLEEMEGTAIDAWYLDGFSPAKNPDMWSEGILAKLGQLSGEGTSVATFTAAGDVRRGLMAAGFTVQKVAGFGHKRDMLVGKMQTKTAQALPPQRTHCVVIGAGIAGATVAHALAERGYKVTVLERGQVASGASGNAAGVLFPQLTKQWNRSTAWYFTSYGFALRQLSHWKSQGVAVESHRLGMLRLPRHAGEEAQLRALNETLGLDPDIVHWVEREEASDIAGVELMTGAAYFPHGTWISPAPCCRALLQHEHIMLREQTAAISIVRKGEGWTVTLENGEVLHAPYVCVASAQESAPLLHGYGIALNMVGGQMSLIAASNVAAPLRSILCHKGYVIPHGENYLVGATYHREEMLVVTPARHAENAEQLEGILPGWFQGTVHAGRSAIRATTPDRMPYIGAVDAGLYVSTGHGSRGLLNAPLAAEMIASHIAGEMPPVTQALAQAVHPLRFKR